MSELQADLLSSKQSADLIPGALPESPDDRDRERITHKPLWTSLIRGRGLVGTILIGVVILLGLLAPLLTSFSPNEQLEAAYLLRPGSVHFLGTDDVNRDILTRVLYGIRVDLLIVFLAVPVGALAGSVIGVAAAFSKWGDIVTQRISDILLAFPALILAIALSAILGPGLRTVFVVIVIAEIPLFGRLLRTSALRIRALPFIEAAQVSGAGNLWLIRKHLLPNSLEPLSIQLALSMSVAVIVEGAMSFLNLGVVPPTPSLGSILAQGNDYLESNPAFVVGPLVIIVVLVLGFLLIAQSFASAQRS